MIDVDPDGLLRLRGRLGMQNAGALVAPLAEQAARHSLLRIDLKEVDEADSAALALLLNTLRAAQAEGHRIKIENWPPSLRGLLPLYSLDIVLSADAGDA